MTEGESGGPAVIVLAFDLLLLNGESLLRNTLRERRQKLRAPSKAGKWLRLRRFAMSTATATTSSRPRKFNKR